MLAEIYPLQVLLLTVSGIVNRHHANVIAYLVEENRVLKDQFGGKVPRLNDDQRRRLSAKAKSRFAQFSFPITHFPSYWQHYETHTNAIARSCNPEC